VDDTLRAFAGFAYNLEAMANYQTGPNSGVPLDFAAEAVDIAKRFVAKMADLFGSGGDAAG
jgi:hypothetical protein